MPVNVQVLDGNVMIVLGVLLGNLIVEVAPRNAVFIPTLETCRGFQRRRLVNQDLCPVTIGRIFDMIQSPYPTRHGTIHRSDRKEPTCELFLY